MDEDDFSKDFRIAPVDKKEAPNKPAYTETAGFSE